MAKMFVASVRCPIGQMISTFVSISGEGYHRKILKAATISQVAVDLDAIDARVQQLLNYDKKTSYAKQKDSLQKKLEGFFSALPCCHTCHCHSARPVSFSSLQRQTWKDTDPP